MAWRARNDSRRPLDLPKGIAAALLSLLALAHCEGHPPPRGIDAGHIVATDAASDTPDAAPTGNCPRFALPPEELHLGANVTGGTSIAWSGDEWGVAWSEETAEGPTVFFSHIGADGHRRGPPVRVSERGYRGLAPSVAWNGENWNVAFAGGASRMDEIWLGRIDTRGAVMGRPHRVTARDRRDESPALAFNGHEQVLAWSGTGLDGRSSVFVLRTDRWGSQLEAPLLVASRAEHLTSAQVVWNGDGWGVAWLLSRSEAVAVDMSRVDARAEAVHGSTARMTLGVLGGTDLSARFGVAWDGTRYALVWDEIRDGAPHIFFDTATPRLNSIGQPVMLSAPGLAATSPALLSLAPDLFVSAWEVERGVDTHVQVATFDGTGHALGEPIEVQGNDGRAGTPELVASPERLGLVTLSPRGVSFHRVVLGPCEPRREHAEPLRR